MDYSSKIKRMSENMAADYHVALGKKEAAEERLYTAEASKNAYESRENVLREELNVILKAGVKQLEYAADNLSDAATHTMRNVFGPEYTKLKIELDTSSRDSLATILVGKMDEGVEYFAEPYEDNGGGMNDTISTVLKLSALIGYEPDVDNALLADEPSKSDSGLAIFR